MSEGSLSVAMATRDGGPFLGRQLESIAAQTRPPDEVVVVDDGSIDDSVATLEAFARTSSFPVVVHRMVTSTGPIRAFERAIAATSGDVVALSDQDDLWHPHKLERVERALQDRPAVELVYSDADLVDERGNPVKGSLWQRLGATPSLRRAVETEPPGPLLRMSLVSGCAMAFRGSLRQAALPFPPSIAQDPGTLFHDRWLALVAACVGGVAALDERLFAFRIHEGQLTGLPASPPPRHTALRLTLDDVARHQLALVAQLEDLEARCVALGSPAPVINRIIDAQSHLTRRATMPRTRVRRIGVVTRAMVSGGYRRAGQGPTAAIADLLRPGTEPSSR